MSTTDKTAAERPSPLAIANAAAAALQGGVQ